MPVHFELFILILVVFISITRKYSIVRAIHEHEILFGITDAQFVITNILSIF